MTITGFYVSKRPKIGIKKAHKLARFCAQSFMALGVSAAPAFAGMDSIGKAAGLTFGAGSPGLVIIQLMLIAVVGWLAGYIASAVGKGQIAGMIHIATVFTCITLVAGVAINCISKFGDIIGL